MLNEEKISSRMVEMANRSDGRKGLYCICSHMGWSGFLSDGGKVEIPLEGIPGHIKTDSIRIDRRVPGEWLQNYRVSPEKIYFSNNSSRKVLITSTIIFFRHSGRTRFRPGAGLLSNFRKSLIWTG